MESMYYMRHFTKFRLLQKQIYFNIPMSIYLPIIKKTGAKEEMIKIKEDTIIIIFIILSFLKNFFIFILINIILNK